MYFLCYKRSLYTSYGRLLSLNFNTFINQKGDLIVRYKNLVSSTINRRVGGKGGKGAISKKR